MAPMGLGMICTYPSLGRWTKRFGIRRTSAGGASLAFLGTLPLLYLSGHHLDLTILAGALFMRGMGMSAVGIPSISAAYAAVGKEDLPMATTSLNIVHRLGGPTLTTFLRNSSGLATDGCSFALACSQRIYDQLCPAVLPPRAADFRRP